MEGNNLIRIKVKQMQNSFSFFLQVHVKFCRTSRNYVLRLLNRWTYYKLESVKRSDWISLHQEGEGCK